MKLQTWSLSSQSLEETLEGVVRSRTNGMIRNLRVEIVNGEIIISGRAKTYYAKQLATHATLDAVKSVTLINDIEVC